MLSATSTALPTARPSGWSIRVIRATTDLPRPQPISHIARARARESSSRSMKAPPPVLTSSTRPSIPSASFLDMIDAAISGIDSTVAVASRIA